MANSSSFTNYYKGVFLKPSDTFNRLVQDERASRFGLLAISICAIVYTLVYVFLILGGGEPYKPWLNIPPEIYYRYNVLFLAPSMFASWILAAGVAHLLSKLFTDKGSFDHTLAAYGFSISIASWSTGLHDLISSFLGALKIIDQHKFEIALNTSTFWRGLLWALMLAYVAWFVSLFYKSIKAIQKIKTIPAVFIALFSFLVYQLLFFVFNR